MPETRIADRVVLDLRSRGIPEVPMLGRYNFTHAHEGLVEHVHPGAMEICYLAKGTQIYRVGFRHFVLRGGDVFVTFPGEEHSTGEAPQEKGVLYWIHFIRPGATVTEVAFRLSFSSSQYFATVFKRYTGKSPGALLSHRCAGKAVDRRDEIR